MNTHQITASGLNAIIETTYMTTYLYRRALVSIEAIISNIRFLVSWPASQQANQPDRQPDNQPDYCT